MQTTKVQPQESHECNDIEDTTTTLYGAVFCFNWPSGSGRAHTAQQQYKTLLKCLNTKKCCPHVCFLPDWSLFLIFLLEYVSFSE